MVTMKKVVAKKAPTKYETGGQVAADSKNAKPTTKPTAKPKPKPKTVSQRIGDITLRDIKNSGEDALNLSTLGMYRPAKKKIKEALGMKNGGALKKVPAGKVGLGKLPTAVRNKMGYQKNGGAMKAKSGTSLGMKSVKSGYDNNSGVTRADFVSIGKGKAKSGVKMKMGGNMAKQAAVAIAMKKAGKAPKKAMNGYGGAAASMAPMKAGGKMAKCKYGCK